MMVLDLETLRQAKQKHLDAGKSAQERNRMGQFATPFALADEIARYIKTLWAEHAEPVHFLEPSLGTGAFYSALRGVFETSQIADATGIEIDPLVAQTAQTLWSETGLRVIEGDFTTLTPTASYNLILANPPYVRHHHLPNEQKVALQRRVHDETGYNVHGLAGLYCYFMLLADHWLVDEGLGVWLIPSEFMDVNYGEVLRRYLTEQVTLLHIHRARPDELQFDEALVSSAIVIYRKAPPTPDHTVRFTLGGSLETPAQEESVPVHQLGKQRKWTQFPSISKSTVQENTTSVCFGDLFEIKRGIATGANEFFILSRADAHCRGLPEQYLHPLLPSPRYLTDLIIATEDDGFPHLAQQAVLLDCPLPPDQIQAQYPRLAAYLSEGQRQGLDQRYLATKRTPWYRQEQRPVAPFLCTYMGRDLKTRGPFRFFWNQSQALATNVYLLLYPTQVLAEALRLDPTLYAEIFKRLMAIDFRHLMGEGRVYGGALHKIEPRELSRAALPGFETFAYSTKQLSLF